MFELRKEDRADGFLDSLGMNFESRAPLKQLESSSMTDLIEVLDRKGSKDNGINILAAAQSIECLLLLYQGLQKQEFAPFSQEQKSNDNFANFTEDFHNKFLQVNQHGTFLELDLIKRFLFILSQLMENAEGIKSSARAACIRDICFLLNFFEERIDQLQPTEAATQVVRLVALIEIKLLDAKQYSQLDKISGASDYSLILTKCTNLVLRCAQNDESKNNQEFLAFRLKMIEKNMKWYLSQCQALVEKVSYSKDQVQGIIRAKSRYLVFELASLLSTGQRDMIAQFCSWINPEQILANVEKIIYSGKKVDSKADLDVIFEILLLLLHIHRIFVRSKERLLSHDNLKKTLTFVSECCRITPSNFHQVMNCLSNMTDAMADAQKACFEIGFTNFFIQNVGFNESLFDSITTSCFYELYRPPKDIPTLPSLTWQANLTPINDTINYKIWSELLFPYRIDWRKVLILIANLLDKANKEVNQRLSYVCQLIASSAQPEAIERANRAFTSEFQKYGHLIFLALTNCETLELDPQGEEFREFAFAFGKIATEALKLFFSISLTLLRYEKDDSDLCKERQSMVELTANFMNLKRVKPFVDEFIANFWQEHMINPISKFDDKKMSTLAVVLTKIAKISEISPQFKETHRKDLFHTIMLYLIQSKQPGKASESEIVLFDTLEEIEMAVWLMRLLSLINSCGNSNISGTNSTVRGVEERVKKQLKTNLKLVERFVVSIIRQRTSRIKDKFDETKHKYAFYEILDRLARCLLYGPYFLKTPRGLLGQTQIDALLESFDKYNEALCDPKRDKEKLIQPLFERIVLNTFLLGLYSNTKKPNSNDTPLADYLKNEKYIGYVIYGVLEFFGKS